MAPPTKCDILRDGVRARMNADACGGASPPAGCSVLTRASDADALFYYTYGGPLAGAARAEAADLIRGDVAAAEARIRAAYGPGAPADLSWYDLTLCLWNPEGLPGGLYQRKYFGRRDLEGLGYKPAPILGGAALEGRLPPALTDAVPVWLDRAVNPDLAVVLVFLLLLLVFAGLLRAAYRSEKGRAPQGEALASRVES